MNEGYGEVRTHTGEPHAQAQPEPQLKQTTEVRVKLSPV